MMSLVSTLRNRLLCWSPQAQSSAMFVVTTLAQEHAQLPCNLNQAVCDGAADARLTPSSAKYADNHDTLTC